MTSAWTKKPQTIVKVIDISASFMKNGSTDSSHHGILYCLIFFDELLKFMLKLLFSY
jgi:hypothetical protein